MGFVPDLLVVATVAFAFLAWHFDLGTRWGLAAPDPATEPALVLPPEGLALPVQHPATEVAKPLVSSQASPSAVARTVHNSSHELRFAHKSVSLRKCARRDGA